MSLFGKTAMQAKARSVEHRLEKSAPNLLEAAFKSYSPDDRYDIFFSHSYKDAEVVLGIIQTIKDLGFSVYVDWIDDATLSRFSVTTETAFRLQVRMTNCSCLFYALSDNSRGSVWTPWELGFCDGMKRKIAILPVSDTDAQTESYRGQEYLGLYPYVTLANDEKSRPSLWINETPTKYISLRAWLNGQLPQVHPIKITTS